MKKITWILMAVAIVAIMAAPGVALANVGPHGYYVADTDACAGCHRAHTAPSSITWIASDDSVHSALLLQSSPTVSALCLSCHDSNGQGADTDVLSGRYLGTTYGTLNATMTSGPFGRSETIEGVPGDYDFAGNMVTSKHLYSGVSWGAYGGGASGSPTATLASSVPTTENFGAGMGPGIVMDCNTCHDPHGSSNYRILKDRVNGVTVGGYDASDSPTPYVISSEEGFPIGGFALHTDYLAQGYKPNYTKAQYAKAPGVNDTKGMVGWCVSCHTQYATKVGTTAGAAVGYNAGDGFNEVVRHRHPVNVPLTNFLGPRALALGGLPLAHNVDTGVGTAVNERIVANKTNTTDDWIECLTCHNAHGSTAVMSGYANVADSMDPVVDSGSGGVDPSPNSALLKMNNRGVCESCHNK